MRGAIRMMLGRRSIRVADDFERADSTTVMNPASDGGTWVFDYGSGVLDAQWGVISGGGYMPSPGSNSLGNGSTADRELGTVAQDVTWTLANTSAPYDLSSRLRLCSFGATPGHPTAEKNIALGYNGGAGSFTIGIEDFFGYTPLGAGGGSVTLAGWGGSTTVIRMVYLPSTHTLTIYQNGGSVYSGVLSSGEYTGLGTGAGVRFRRAYSLFGERLLDFLAINSE
jgi:type 1 fimbria pilin